MRFAHDHALQLCVNCPSCHSVTPRCACLVGQITTILLPIPPHRRGAFARRHDTWSAGSGGRRYVRCIRAETTGAAAYGEVVWSWPPGAEAERRRVSRVGRDTGAREPVPGESTYKPSNHRAGKAGYLAEPVVLPRAFLLHADRGYQSIPGLPCALCSRRVVKMQSSGNSCRENAIVCAALLRRHCEERKRRSNPESLRDSGLLRFARNDGARQCIKEQANRTQTP